MIIKVLLSLALLFVVVVVVVCVFLDFFLQGYASTKLFLVGEVYRVQE